MGLSPQTIDMLIITILEGIQVLGRISKGEEITDADLRLESWEETVARVKHELGKGE